MVFDFTFVCCSARSNLLGDDTVVKRTTTSDGSVYVVVSLISDYSEPH